MDDRGPELSIIIPAYAAERHIQRCLDALARQSAPPSSFEVIVVDDHSPDSSAQIAERAGARVVRHDQNRGAAAARNTGARAARGGVLLFLDSDVVPSSDLAAVTLRLFEDDSVSAATGCYAAEPANDTDFARYKALWTWYCWARSGGLSGRSSHLQGALAAIRAPVFEQLEGFDESYRGGSVEDYEFSERLRAEGLDIHFDEQLSGRHHFPSYSTCARNYWDRARMWSKLASKGTGFSSGQASKRNAIAAVSALGSVVGGMVPLAGPLLALGSGLSYLAAAAPFLSFVHSRTGLRFTAYSAGVHWSLSVVVGAAALSSPFGSGSRSKD